MKACHFSAWAGVSVSWPLMHRRKAMTTTYGSAEMMDNLLMCALEAQEVKVERRSSALNLHEVKIDVRRGWGT
jgi:hypothetical protein